jgi:small multidrug resistance family-3 protein
MAVGAWLVFIAAAILEVGGDALIRKGLRGSGLALIVAGFGALGCYCLVVNIVRWDFSRLLGVYVAVFAVISVLAGRVVFRENVPVSTWIGLAVIVAGGLIINISSMVTKRVIPGLAAYSSTKSALNMLSDTARVELAPDNIRVITVYPRLTATDFGRNSLGDPQVRQRQRQHTTTGPNPADSPELVADRILEAAQREPPEQFMDA